MGTSTSRSRSLLATRARDLPPLGEYRLLISLMQDAWHCYSLIRYSQSAKTRQQYEEVIQWFHSPCDAPFTFIWVCHMLGLSATQIREWLTAESKATPTYQKKVLKRREKEYTKSIVTLNRSRRKQ